MRRAAVLLALLGMMILVYSAPMAEAALNKVRCTTKPNCEGTRQGDRLIDRAGSFTDIRGKDGNDTYVERSGSSTKPDRLYDSGTTSDTYYISGDDFNTAAGDALLILDEGGSNDSLDLRDTGYTADPDDEDRDCDVSREDDDLRINCPGADNILVYEWFNDGDMDVMFEDGTFYD